MSVMLKKSISILLAFVMLFSMIPVMKKAESKAVSKEEIPDGYTPIYDEADLAGINNDPKGKYILMNDIDLSETKKGGEIDNGNGWRPLKEFSGELDGNGYYIKNMHIYGTLKEGNYGLFEYLSGTGSIKRLGIKDVDIDIDGVESYADVGALAGGCIGEVEQCFVTGTVSGCAVSLASGSASDKGLDMGGFFGYSGDYERGEITDCYNGADITVSNNQKVNAGAFYGTGKVDTTNCYNVGKIADGTGTLFDNGYTRNCFYLQGSGTGEEGSPLTGSQMKKKQYYTKFDFENVWEIDSLHKYQFPQLKECVQQRVQNLKIVELPSKREYFQGDVVDLTGGTINVTYEDGYEVTAPLTDEMLGNFDMTKIGEVSVPIVKGGATTSFLINVKEIEVSSLSLNQDKLSLKPGDEYQLSVIISPANASNKNILWNSSNDTVATVDQKGYVKALKCGTTIITATASNKKKTQCTVVVETPADAVEIIHDSNNQTFYAEDESYDNVIVLKEGEWYQCGIRKYPSDSSDTIKWETNNSVVAQVSSSGMIQANSMGTATIKATAKSGARSSVRVFVRRNISKCTADAIPNQEYKNKGIYPDIVLRDMGVILNYQNYNVEYKNNDKPGQAVVVVTASGNGYYYGQKEIYFIISAPAATATPVPKPTIKPQPVKSNPSNSGSQTNSSANRTNNQNIKVIKAARVKIKSVRNLKGRKIKVTWKKIKGVSGYEVEIARNRKMSKDYWAKDTSSNSMICKKRKKKKYYYVRVRAYYETEDEIIDSKWSTVKKIKITK